MIKAGGRRESVGLPLSFCLAGATFVYPALAASTDTSSGADEAGDAEAVSDGEDASGVVQGSGPAAPSSIDAELDRILVKVSCPRAKS